MKILITSNLTRCLGFNFRWKQRRQKVSVTTSEPWKKTGKDSGIRAFISVSTWEISTLYRVLPLCLCLLSSFRVSVEKKGMHSAACKLWGWTLGLCFVSLSGRREGREGEGAKEEKKRRIGRALLRSRYTRYFRESSTVHVQVKQLSRCLWTRSRAQPRVIMENGGRGCLHFLRRFQFLFQVTTQQRCVRIIVVETEKLHTMTIYILRRSNDNLYTLFLDILRLHPQTIFQIIVDIITYNNFFQS